MAKAMAAKLTHTSPRNNPRDGRPPVMRCHSRVINNATNAISAANHTPPMTLGTMTMGRRTSAETTRRFKLSRPEDQDRNVTVVGGKTPPALPSRLISVTPSPHRPEAPASAGLAQAAEPALTPAILVDHLLQILAGKRRPRGGDEDQLGISGLPQHEVG